VVQFDTIDYLKNGNPRQQRAYTTLTQHAVLEHLKNFDPILVGTIPINIDIDESDLDIICNSTDLNSFKAIVGSHFKSQEGFKTQEMNLDGMETVVVSFMLDGFKIELFCQPLHTKLQLGYRHMLIECQLLQEKGEGFRQQIIELKRKGFKTEPAFAQALGLKGDPYVELLNYQNIEGHD
jgi:hypothetical protein